MNHTLTLMSMEDFEELMTGEGITIHQDATLNVGGIEYPVRDLTKKLHSEDVGIKVPFLENLPNVYLRLECYNG